MNAAINVKYGVESLCLINEASSDPEHRLCSQQKLAKSIVFKSSVVDSQMNEQPGEEIEVIGSIRTGGGVEVPAFRIAHSRRN